MAQVAMAQANYVACLPQGERTAGFSARFFPYALSDLSSYKDPAYMGYGYANQAPVGSVSGIETVGFRYYPCILHPGVPYCTRTVFWGSDIYGFNTTPSNFTVEVSGYFLAPLTGQYTIGLPQVDDSAALQFGDGAAFNCCQQNLKPPKSTNFSIDAVRPLDAVGYNAQSSAQVSLIADFYYPIRLVYTNLQGNAVLGFNITLPDGRVITDFTNYAFSFPADVKQPSCAITNPVIPITSTTTR